MYFVNWLHTADSNGSTGETTPTFKLVKTEFFKSRRCMTTLNYRNDEIGALPAALMLWWGTWKYWTIVIYSYQDQVIASQFWV